MTLSSHSPTPNAAFVDTCMCDLQDKPWTHVTQSRLPFFRASRGFSRKQKNPKNDDVNFSQSNSKCYMSIHVCVWWHASELDVMFLTSMLMHAVSYWIDILRSADVNKYLEHMEVIARELLALLMEGLGLPPTCLNQHFSRTADNPSFYRWNHYPTCTRPDLAIGIGAHTDPWVLTILAQDDVGGLQVLKDRRWMGIRPLPGALVVNIGDTLQVILPPHSISNNPLMISKHDWWF